MAWSGFAGLALAAAVGAIDARPPADAPAVEILDAAFGVFDASSDWPPAFTPAAVVPCLPGQAYGWTLRVKTAQPQVRWREEFTLPAAPRSWGASDPNRALSDDARVAVTDRTEAPEDGVIRNIWTVAPGDPKGAYEIKVTVEGVAPVTFRFEVR
jgi:hypothetical protein